MTYTSYKALDILEGRASIRGIEQRYVVVWDTVKAHNLIAVINMMASEGWTVRQCWGLVVSETGPCHFSLLERISQPEQS